MSPMPRINKGDTENVYFLSPTVVEWINIFTKRKYFEILADSLKYCIKNKGLILYEYVFMTNHIHLIAGVKDGQALQVPDRATEPSNARGRIEGQSHGTSNARGRIEGQSHGTSNVEGRIEGQSHGTSNVEGRIEGQSHGTSNVEGYYKQTNK